MVLNSEEKAVVSKVLKNITNEINNTSVGFIAVIKPKLKSEFSIMLCGST